MRKKWNLRLIGTAFILAFWNSGANADIYCNVAGETGGPVARVSAAGAGSFLNGVGLSFQMMAALELRERSRAAGFGRRATEEFGRAVGAFKQAATETRDLLSADQRLERVRLNPSLVAERLQIPLNSPPFQEILRLGETRRTQGILGRCLSGSEQSGRDVAGILDIIGNRDLQPTEVWRFEAELQRELSIGRIISGFFVSRP
jgi:hypothetical protein